MAALERFIHDEHSPYPTLVKAALAYVQFETIHPFLDGNGRVGRLLIAFMLHHGGVLSKPLLYLSLYFKQHRPEYYRLLDLVRTEGDWEAWLDFFLEGVEDTASNAVQTAQSLVHLFKEDSVRVQAVGRSARHQPETGELWEAPARGTQTAYSRRGSRPDGLLYVLTAEENGALLRIEPR